eukprot:1026477-Prymnesium_polylepis.1
MKKAATPAPEALAASSIASTHSPVSRMKMARVTAEACWAGLEGVARRGVERAAVELHAHESEYHQDKKDK